jgi:O-antigen ligase
MREERGRRRTGRPWVAVTATLGLAAACGTAVAMGGLLRVSAIGIGLALASSAFVMRKWRPLERGSAFVELPVLLILFSGLVFRVRTTQALAATPLDSAAAYRVLCVALAASLGFAGVRHARKWVTGPRQISTLPFKLYGAYVLVVLFGSLLSPDPLLTAYRGAELGAMMLALAGAWTVAGSQASRRIGTLLYWFVALLTITVWAEVILFPGRAIGRLTYAPIPWDIQGIFPLLTTNTVGTLGVLLAIWSLARTRPGGSMRPMSFPVALPLALLGVASVLGAQYRTGYVALVVAFLLTMYLQRRYLVLGSMAILAIAALIYLPSIIPRAQPFVLRGDTAAEARQLDSRTQYWSAALKVWRTSPLFGAGLETATRFDVLSSQLGGNTTSTIHGGWVEALVGTGIVGTVALGLSAIVAVRRSVARAIQRDAWGAPLLLLVVLLIRSLTGTSFEGMEYTTVIYLWLCLSLPDRPKVGALGLVRASAAVQGSGEKASMTSFRMRGATNSPSPNRS